MKTYVALLRGINVSGQKKMPMAILRQQLEKLGLQQVQTYIQSGNVVFTHPETSTAELSKMISDMIVQKYQFEVPVLVFAQNELDDVVKNNPYLPQWKDELKFLHVTPFR